MQSSTACHEDFKTKRLGFPFETELSTQSSRESLQLAFGSNHHRLEGVKLKTFRHTIPPPSDTQSFTLMDFLCHVIEHFIIPDLPRPSSVW